MTSVKIDIYGLQDHSFQDYSDTQWQRNKRLPPQPHRTQACSHRSRRKPESALSFLHTLRGDFPPQHLPRRHRVGRAPTCLLSAALLLIARALNPSEHPPVCELPPLTPSPFFLTLFQDSYLLSKEHFSLRYKDEKESKKGETSFIFLFISLSFLQILSPGHRLVPFLQITFNIQNITLSRGHCMHPEDAHLSGYCVPCPRHLGTTVGIMGNQGSPRHSHRGVGDKENSLKIFLVRLIWYNGKILPQRIPVYMCIALKKERGNTSHKLNSLTSMGLTEFHTNCRC